ncbi:MAG: S8 family serine peptidase [Armatimonadetes bacterium]|nr:S8 family serine peptidase [Armatimonadota bacterium]
MQAPGDSAAEPAALPEVAEMLIKMLFTLFGRTFRITAFAAVLCVLFSPAFASGPGGGNPSNRPLYVEGDLLVQLREGSNVTTAAAVATKASARIVTKLPLENWYQIRSFNPETQTTKKMLEAIGSDPRVLRAEANGYGYVQAVPTDPLYPQQWALQMIRAPLAWDITKGAETVKVAVVDTGVRADHPDLSTRLIAGYDVADGDADTNPPEDCEALQEMTHGTHVAGIIAAQGDNGVGIVGVCWDKVKIIPIKVFADQGGGAEWSWVVQGLEEAKRRGAQVVNMSLGGYYRSAALEAKCRELANSGIIIVVSTGNDNGPVAYPAAFPDCMAVASVGPSGNKASYSNFGPEVDIAAPGGQMSSNDLNDPGGVLSCIRYCFGAATAATNGWGTFQGTSMAAPYVAGAAALLLSAGMPASSVRAALEGTAQPKGTKIPNDQYGYGILDVNAALRYSPVNVNIDRPREGDVLSTLKPLIRVRLAGAAPQSISVQVDGVTVISGQSASDSRVENFNYSTSSGEMSFSWAFSEEGTHRVVVSAAAIFNLSKIKSASVSFDIKGPTLPPGLYMFSRPFGSAVNDPASVLKTPLYRLARAVPELDDTGTVKTTYAMYNYPGLANDPRASLRPTDVIASQTNGLSETLPRGVGYWLRLNATTKLLENEVADDRYSYDMSLAPGWNQIGNPYPYPIAWGSVLVTYMGETVSITDAARRGWISPSLYSYENNVYVSQTAPEGTLQPWLGYWVRSKVPLTGGLTSVDDVRGRLTIHYQPLQNESAVMPSIAQPAGASLTGSSTGGQSEGSGKVRAW